MSVSASNPSTNSNALAEVAGDDLRGAPLAGALYIGVVSLCVVNILPALTNVLASGLGWDDLALGRFATADVGGVALGALAGTSLVKRASLRAVVLLALMVLAMADIACASVSAFSVMAIARFIGGGAGGIMLSACYGLYSISNAQRNYGAFQVGQMGLALAGMTAIPFLFAAFGWRSVFYAMSALVLAAVPLALLLPNRPFKPVATPQGGNAVDRFRWGPWIAVCGLTFYIIGQGATWTYMARIALYDGISQHDVDTALSYCAAAGIVGSFASMASSKRLGLFVPLIASGILSVVSVALMASRSVPLYTFAVCAFTLLWPCFAAYQFSLVASADKIGTATILISASTYAGFAVGPYLGGELMVRYGFQAIQVLAIVGTSVAILSLLPIALAPRRR